MSTPRLRFAVVGAGVIGKVHAKALGELPDVAELVAVVDADADRAKALADEHGVAVATTDLAAVLARDDVDAVCICTPSGLHADGAVAALEAGKHVVVEKPLDVSLEAADRVIDAEKRSGKTVAVISQHRFDRSTEKLLAALRAGHLGTITSAIASHAWWRGQSYYDSGEWRGTWALDGGGVLMNQAIHTIDALLWMFGPVVRASGRVATRLHRIEVEDTAAAVLEFASGAFGVIEASTAAFPGFPRRIEVMGTTGSLVHEQTARPAVVADATGHQRVFEDFLAAIASDSAPACDAREGRRSVSVIEAIYRSARSGRSEAPE
jgi:predicted dehydrogenase